MTVSPAGLEASIRFERALNRSAPLNGKYKVQPSHTVIVRGTVSAVVSGDNVALNPIVKFGLNLENSRRLLGNYRSLPHPSIADLPRQAQLLVASPRLRLSLRPSANSNPECDSPGQTVPIRVLMDFMPLSKPIPVQQISLAVLLLMAGLPAQATAPGVETAGEGIEASAIRFRCSAEL